MTCSKAIWLGPSDRVWCVLPRNHMGDCTAPSGARQAAAPRHETSASIAQWQLETFGPAKATWDRIDRSDDLMRGAMWNAKVAVGNDPAADRPNLSVAMRAAEELAELIERLVIDDNDPKAPEEVADIEIVLARITAAFGLEQADCKDAKMIKNRARKWKLTGDGHGQHE